MGSGKLNFKELAELRERCEVLERKKIYAEKELDELHETVDALRYFQEDVDQYGRAFGLAYQIERLKACLVNGEKHGKKVS